MQQAGFVQFRIGNIQTVGKHQQVTAGGYHGSVGKRPFLRLVGFIGQVVP